MVDASNLYVAHVCISHIFPWKIWHIWHMWAYYFWHNTLHSFINGLERRETKGAVNWYLHIWFWCVSFGGDCMMLLSLLAPHISLVVSFLVFISQRTCQCQLKQKRLSIYNCLSNFGHDLCGWLDNVAVIADTTVLVSWYHYWHWYKCQCWLKKIKSTQGEVPHMSSQKLSNIRAFQSCRRVGVSIHTMPSSLVNFCLNI